MTTTANPDFEQIVRMVVQRLRDSGTSTAGLIAPITLNSAGEGESAQTNQAGTLWIDEPLVVLADIENRLDGIQILQIGRKTLLTPSVRDELRRRNVSLVRGRAEKPNLLAISSHSHKQKNGCFQVFAQAEKLKTIVAVAQDIDVQTHDAGANLEDVVKQLAGQLSTDWRVVWCALQPYAALSSCISQGNQPIRAVGLHHLADLQQALSEAQPNLLIVDDRRWSGYQVAKLLQIWSRRLPSESGQVK